MRNKNNAQTPTNKSQLELFSLGFEFDKPLVEVKRDTRLRVQ